MSIERAAMNCKRCYELVELICEDKKIDPISTYDERIRVHEDILKNDQVYGARNETMKSIEVIEEKNRIKPLLNKCLNCYFESPKIYDSVCKK